jgi:hypothetical protein
MNNNTRKSDGFKIEWDTSAAGLCGLCYFIAA